MGGLASLAKKDWMNTHLRLTLTNHVVVLKKKFKIWHCLKKMDSEREVQKQVREAGGLASLAKKHWMNTRLHLTLTNHVVGV